MYLPAHACAWTRTHAPSPLAISVPTCSVDTPEPVRPPFVRVGKALGFVPLAAWSCLLPACVCISSHSWSLWDEYTRVLGGRCLQAVGGPA